MSNNEDEREIIPVFEGNWQKAFATAKIVCGYKPVTKNQLREAGYSIGKKQLPPPVAAVEYSKSKNGLLYL